MNTRLKYYLYLCDEYAMRLLIGEDAIDREIRTQRRGWAEVREAFAAADHRRRW